MALVGGSVLKTSTRRHVLGPIQWTSRTRRQVMGIRNWDQYQMALVGATTRDQNQMMRGEDQY